jgi:hypothetical protein
MICYRICERKNNKLYTLFHGIQGSREMPLGKWMNADIKPVNDGNGTTYISGFHCLEDIDETRNFIKMFRKQRDLVLVECEVEGIRKKNHSRHNVLLVDRMKLNKIIEKLEIKNGK